MNTTPKAIGIDIGGTKISVAAVDGLGAIVARATLATEAERGFARGVERIAAAIDEVAGSAGWGRAEWGGIGIGCAGPVNPVRGTIHNPYTLPTWDDGNIVEALHQRFGRPVFLENDADAALLGECFIGAGRGCRHAVMLTFGTGIGGAALVNGEIHRGCNGAHPEIGHVPVEVDGPPCYCGTRGCLEAIASGTALGEAGRVAGFADSREVFTRAAVGDGRAKAIIERAVRAAAGAAWTVLHTFVPQRIILGGGIMAEHFDLFAPAMRERIAAATQVPGEHITVARAELGNDAGAIGAAWLALRADGRIGYKLGVRPSPGAATSNDQGA